MKDSKILKGTQCLFDQLIFCQLILLFSLFLLIFIGSTAFFGTIYESHCTISTNIYLNIQYFQQKVFSFSKISGSQTDSYQKKKDNGQFLGGMRGLKIFRVCIQLVRQRFEELRKIASRVLENRDPYQKSSLKDSPCKCEGATQISSL